MGRTTCITAGVLLHSDQCREIPKCYTGSLYELGWDNRGQNATRIP